MNIIDELLKELANLGAVEVLDYYNPLPERNKLKIWRQKQIRKCIRLAKKL